MFGLVVFLWIIQDDIATAWEAAALVSIFVVYVGLVIFLYMSGKEKAPPNPHLHEAECDGGAETAMLIPLTAQDTELSLSSSPVTRRFAAGDHSIHNQPALSSFPNMGTSILVNTEKMFFISRPVIEFVVPPLYPNLSPSRNPLFHYITNMTAFSIDPSVKPGSSKHDVSLHRVAAIFVISVALIGILSSMLLNLVQYSLKFIALDSSTVSATLMALGSEVSLLYVNFTTIMFVQHILFV